ncbi:MAG: glycosyltransferase [Patescibacteria group bacterium]
MTESVMSALGGSALGRKIAVIHSIYKPHTRGGAEVVVENIVTGLKNNGEDVFVVSVGYKNKFEDIDGIRVYRIKPFNLFNFLDINSKPVWLRLPWHILDMFNDLQIWRIYKVLKQEKPDLILTHNLKGLGYCIPWLIRIMKIKHVHSVHDMQLIHPSGLLKSNQKLNFLIKIYAWLNGKLFNKIEAVIFPSKYIKSAYDSYGFFALANKLVLANPILNHRADFKIEDKNNSQPQLLFLGQVEEYKGIFDLIAAIKKMKSDFTLHVVGDGSALELAKKNTKGDDRFKFYGRLSHLELKEKIWPKIDLLINPTKVPESFGMVIIEAMSYGIPSLAADIGATSELIEEGRTGWLFESGNIEELKEKIESISKNICAYQPLRFLGQEKAKEFSIDNYLNKLREFVKIRTT